MVLTSIVLYPSSSRAGDATRTQSFPLKEGWNAIWLAVEPTDADPASLFANLPIGRVAHRFNPITSAQFIHDPSEESWNSQSWGIWYREDPTREFISNLHRIRGNQAYLIHCDAPTTWSVSGTVRIQHPHWQANAFNLVGFTVDEQNPPSFADYFSGASGKIGDRIYRMTEGKWIAEEPTSRMRDGEAYWIFCRGKTDYAGPVSFERSKSGTIDFTDRITEHDLVLRNYSKASRTLSVSRVAPNSGSALPLNQVVTDRETFLRSYPDFPTSQQSPEIAAGKNWTLALQLRRERMTQDSQSSLLKITTDLGTVHWIPLTGRKPE